MPMRTIPSNKLKTSWTFYWKMNKARQARFRRHTTNEYKNTLNRLGTVDTLDDFWRQYSCLEAPSNLPCGDIYMMRGVTEPMWENFPNGAAWIMCVDARQKQKNPLHRPPPNRTGGGCEAYIPCVNGLWEEILSAAVRERFGTENLVGVNISVRRNHFKIMLWIRDSGSFPDTSVPDRLLELFRFPQDVQLHYKTFARALNDNSSTLRAQKFQHAPKEELQHTEDHAPAMQRRASLAPNRLPTIMEDEQVARPGIPNFQPPSAAMRVVSAILPDFQAPSAAKPATIYEQVKLASSDGDLNLAFPNTSKVRMSKTSSASMPDHVLDSLQPRMGGRMAVVET